MEWLGMLKVKVVRGIKLAVRDVSNSDPYIVFYLGEQEVRTRVMHDTTDPVWNEELTLYVEDPNSPLKLRVFDEDMFFDDGMGRAEIDLGPLIDARKQDLSNKPDGWVVKEITPGRQNCFAETSKIYWSNRHVTQKMAISLKDVECGEIEMEVTWRSIEPRRI